MEAILVLMVDFERSEIGVFDGEGKTNNVVTATPQCP